MSKERSSGPDRARADHIQIERHGVTIVFSSVPVEHIGEILDRVLSQLGMLEKVHDLGEPDDSPSQVGGYTPVDVPDWGDDGAWDGEVIGFR